MPIWKAVRAGQLSRVLKETYIENRLKAWGIWPLNSLSKPKHKPKHKNASESPKVLLENASRGDRDHRESHGGLAVEKHQTHHEKNTAGDLLVGRDAIRAFLVHLGMPETVDPYWLKRNGTGWPIGSTAGTDGKITPRSAGSSRHRKAHAATPPPRTAHRSKRAVSARRAVKGGT